MCLDYCRTRYEEYEYLLILTWILVAYFIPSIPDANVFQSSPDDRSSWKYNALNSKSSKAMIFFFFLDKLITILVFLCFVFCKFLKLVENTNYLLKL